MSEFKIKRLYMKISHGVIDEDTLTLIRDCYIFVCGPPGPLPSSLVVNRQIDPEVISEKYRRLYYKYGRGSYKIFKNVDRFLKILVAAIGRLSGEYDGRNGLPDYRPYLNSLTKGIVNNRLEEAMTYKDLGSFHPFKSLLFRDFKYENMIKQEVSNKIVQQQKELILSWVENHCLLDNAVETNPVWIPDSASNKCELCGIRFTIVNRRHHCRKCGALICSDCSGFEKTHQRVCKNGCFSRRACRRPNEFLKPGGNKSLKSIHDIRSPEEKFGVVLEVKDNDNTYIIRPYNPYREFVLGKSIDEIYHLCHVSGRGNCTKSARRVNSQLIDNTIAKTNFSDHFPGRVSQTGHNSLGVAITYSRERYTLDDPVFIN
ncbi:MAG: hypothetical protein GY730_09675 [bacterium]|nr:hypothetical protein [bacterium]